MTTFDNYLVIRRGNSVESSRPKIRKQNCSCVCNSSLRFGISNDLAEKKLNNAVAKISQRQDSVFQSTSSIKVTLKGQDNGSNYSTCSNWKTLFKEYYNERDFY